MQELWPRTEEVKREHKRWSVKVGDSRKKFKSFSLGDMSGWWYHQLRSEKPRGKENLGKKMRFIWDTSILIYLEVPTEASERDIQQVGRGQNTYTWEMSVYKLKLNL